MAEGVIRGIFPLITIRSGDMRAARSIFAEQNDTWKKKITLTSA